MQWYEGESADLIRKSKLMYKASINKDGEVVIEGIVTFRANVEVTKKILANLKDFVEKNGLNGISVGGYVLSLEDKPKGWF